MPVERGLFVNPVPEVMGVVPVDRPELIPPGVIPEVLRPVPDVPRPLVLRPVPDVPRLLVFRPVPDVPRLLVFNPVPKPEDDEVPVCSEETPFEVPVVPKEKPVELPMLMPEAEPVEEVAVVEVAPAGADVAMDMPPLDSSPALLLLRRSFWSAEMRLELSTKPVYLSSLSYT